MDAFIKSVICDKDVTSEGVRTVRANGNDTLVKSSENRGDGEAAALVNLRDAKSIDVSRAFLKRPRESTPVENNPVVEGGLFRFDEKCLFCAKDITEEFLRRESKKPIRKRTVVFKIRNAATKEGLVRAAKRHDDDWSKEVLQRIAGMDLLSVGAQYHRPCYSSFCLPKRPSGGKPGRPAESYVTSAMERIFEYLGENRDQPQFTLRELSSLVDDPPTDATLKKKLQEKYKDDIVFTSRVGRASIISFRSLDT